MNGKLDILTPPTLHSAVEDTLQAALRPTILDKKATAYDIGYERAKFDLLLSLRQVLGDHALPVQL